MKEGKTIRGTTVAQLCYSFTVDNKGFKQVSEAFQQSFRAQQRISTISRWKWDFFLIFSVCGEILTVSLMWIVSDRIWNCKQAYYNIHLILFSVYSLSQQVTAGYDFIFRGHYVFVLVARRDLRAERIGW